MQNKLTKILGFSFTHFMEDSLTKKGFSLSTLRRDESNGLEYQELSLSTVNNETVTIEFANVHDEDDFRSYAKKFFPQGHNPTFPQLHLIDPTPEFNKVSANTNILIHAAQSSASPAKDTQHQNGVVKLLALIWKDLALTEKQKAELSFGNGITNYFLDPTDSHVQYFKIRKESDLCALVLTCKNLESFINLSKPDDTFTWQGKKVAHLKEGPNLFDFFIVEEKP